jgi:hypothetical protein
MERSGKEMHDTQPQAYVIGLKIENTVQGNQQVEELASTTQTRGGGGGMGEEAGKRDSFPLTRFQL